MNLANLQCGAFFLDCNLITPSLLCILLNRMFVSNKTLFRYFSKTFQSYPFIGALIFQLPLFALTLMQCVMKMNYQTVLYLYLKLLPPLVKWKCYFFEQNYTTGVVVVAHLHSCFIGCEPESS